MHDHTLGPRRTTARLGTRTALLALSAAMTPLGLALAQDPDLPRALTDEQLRALTPPPLREVPVPEPENLYEFVRDRKAAIALGKALYWDMRVGSQGQACASCHFQAGADPRSRNQLSPGIGVTDAFDRTPTGGGGPNYQLKPEDFPFHRKVDVTKNDTTPGNTLFELNDVVSSQGPKLAEFLGVRRDRRGEYVPIEKEVRDPIFNVYGKNTRRVEPRNTPTVINAAYSVRNFWDGRANFIFNGCDPFGQRSNEANPDQGVWVKYGVSTAAEDLGIGGTDPYGNPLSFSGQLAAGALKDTFLGVTPGGPDAPVPPGAFAQVRAAFKVPGLYNVEYTAPYMHNGGFLTIEQVVEFYARGGNEVAANGPDFTPIIQPIPELLGQPHRIAAVAAFLRTLTDPRVVDECGPFDHPSLIVPNGSKGDEHHASCRDELLRVPAVGERGRYAYRLPPIVKFLEEREHPCRRPPPDMIGDTVGMLDRD